MTAPPDLNLLSTFFAVAEAKSMSTVARSRRQPKSSVSRGIAALEASLGVRLFHRTTRALELTTAGRALYDRARPLVTSLEGLTKSLPENDGEPSGVLRVTAPMSMSLHWLNAAIAEFAARYRRIRLDVQPTNRRVDVVAEGFDVALRMGGELPDSSLVVRRLSRVEIGLYASPLYVARRGEPRAMEEIEGHDWVVAMGKLVPPGLAGLPQKPRLTTDDPVFAYGAIKNGVGIGVLPCFLAQQDVLEGRLLRIVPRWSHTPFSLYFVHPYHERKPRKVAAFLAFVIDYLTAHPMGAA